MPAPLPGQIRSTANNEPRVPPVKAPVEPEPPAAVEAPPPAPEETPEEPPASKELTPAEAYRKRLSNAGIALEHASAIYDAVLTKGYFEEYVNVSSRSGPSQRAVFRTRLYEDTLRLQTALELQRPQLGISQDDIITRYNLAASLYSWKGVPVAHNDDDDFEAALRLVRRLPAPIYTMLARELTKFDAKIILVFSEGAAENF